MSGASPANPGIAHEGETWRDMMSLPIGDQRDRVWQVRGAAGEEALAYFDGTDWRVAPIRPNAELLAFKPVAHADPYDPCWLCCGTRQVEGRECPDCLGQPGAGFTPRGGGEGVREALEALQPFADALGDDDADEPDHTEATLVCGRSTDYSLDLGDFRAARRAVALLTPPTDAGSTTREGGEGVEALWKRACEGREGYCSSDLQDAARWAIGEAFRLAERAARSATLPPGYQWSDGNREKFDFGRDTAADAIAALATTSSPDASPDSWEATDLVVARQQAEWAAQVDAIRGSDLISRKLRLSRFLRGFNNAYWWTRCTPAGDLDAILAATSSPDASLSCCWQSS